MGAPHSCFAALFGEAGAALTIKGTRLLEEDCVDHETFLPGTVPQSETATVVLIMKHSGRRPGRAIV
jgi:hypothetical protein